ncbi:MAG: ABC transporter permease [Vicinamibacterales bacterium]
MSSRVTALVLSTVALVCTAVLRADEPVPGVLVSRQLAEARRLTPGSLVRLAPSADGEDARSFRVVGVYEPTPDPMEISESKFKVRLHLPDMARLTSPDDLLAAEAVDQVNMALRVPERAAALASRLATETPGVVARPVRAALTGVGTFVVIERFHLAIALVTVIASALFLLALSVMLVDERRDTVGVLRLLGLTSRRVLAQIVIESVAVAAGGSLFGVALAAASQAAINAYFQWHYNTALVFVRITPAVVTTCLAVAIPLGVIASTAASWTLLRKQLMQIARR